MILRVNNNDNFNLSLKLIINYELECIEILVILDNKLNKKRQMKQYHANEFKEALLQYKLWETFIF